MPPTNGVIYHSSSDNVRRRHDDINVFFGRLYLIPEASYEILVWVGESYDFS